MRTVSHRNCLGRLSARIGAGNGLALVSLFAVVFAASAVAAQDMPPPEHPLVRERIELTRQAQDAYFDGNIDATITLLRRRLAVEEELFGPESERALDTVRSLAESYAEIDDFDASRPLVERYRQGMLALGGADSWQAEVADTLARFLLKAEQADPHDRRQCFHAIQENLAAWHHRDFETAQRASRIHAQHAGAWLGRDSFHWVVATLDIYAALTNMGETAGVEAQLMKLLAQCEASRGEHHPLTALVRRTIADLLDRQGDQEGAIGYFQQAIADFEASGFTLDASYRHAVNNLAVAYDTQGDYAKALELYRKAVALGQWDEIPGEDDYRIGYDNLARCYDSLAWEAFLAFDFGRAAELYGEAAAVFEKIYGLDHFQTFDARANRELALQYQGLAADDLEKVKEAYALREQMMEAFDKDEFRDARSLAQRRAALVRRLHGAEHPEYAYAVQDIAVYETWLEDDAAASRNYGRALTILSRKLPVNHPQIAGLQLELVVRLDKPLRDELATIQRVLEVYKSSYRVESSEYAGALVVYGDTLLSLGRDQDALDAFRQARRLLRVINWADTEDYCSALYGSARAETRLGRLLRCEPLYREAIRLRQEMYGEADYTYGLYAHEFANLLQDLGDYQEAEKYYLISAEVDKQIGNAESANAAVTLNQLAWVKIRTGDTEGANEYLEQTLKITRALSETTEPYINALLYLAILREDAEQFDEAAELIDEATGAILTLYGYESVNYAQALRRRGEILYAMGRTDEANELWDEAFELLEMLSDETADSPPAEIKKLADEASELAFSRKNLDTLATAIEALELAYRIKQQLYGEDDWQLVDARCDAEEARKYVALPADVRHRLDLADHKIDELAEYAKSGNFSEFRWLTDEIIATYRNTLGEQHRDTANVFYRLANVAADAAHYHDRYQWISKAVAIRDQVLGQRHPDYAVALEAKGRAAGDLQQYDEAVKLLSESIELQSDLFGEQSGEVAGTLLTLSQTFRERGDVVASLDPAKRSLEIRERLNGNASYEYGTVLKELAKTYYLLDEVDRARLSMLEALNVIAKAIGEDNVEFYIAMYDACDLMANIASTQHQFEIAEQYLGECLDYFKKHWGDSHPMVAEVHDSLGVLYVKAERLDEAATQYAAALDIRKASLPENHPSIGDSYANLAEVRADLKQISEAIELYETSLAIHATGYEADSPRLVAPNSRLAKLYARVGRIDDAVSAAQRCLQCNRRELQQVAAWSSETSLESVVDEGDDAYDLLLTIAAANPDKAEYARAAVDWTMRRKGAVLDALCNARSSQRALAYEPAIALQLDKLRELQQREAETLMAGAGNDDGGAATVEQIRTEMAEVRESIAAKLQARGVPLDSFLTADGQTVQGALGDDEALVEFVCWRPFDFETGGWQDNHYLALATSGQSKQWQVKDLGRNRLANAMIERLRTSTRDAQRELQLADEIDLAEQYGETSGRLYRSLFGELDETLADAKRLYVAADGFLLRAPLAALQVDRGQYLIEKYDLAYLSSGRDLLREHPPAGHGTLIFADPDFDLDAVERKLTLARLNTPAPAGELLAMRSAAIDPTRGLRWRPLPGAAVEAKQVATSLAESQFTPVTAYVGAEALEDVFKSARPPRILHIATHGFFIEPQTADRPAMAGASNTSAARLSQLRSQDNALLRSGIVLAGANKLDNPDGTNGSDDGWLTAMEIAALDLHGVELAVLSACNTGMGDPRPGEGVVGMQRAFLHAGAQSMVTSLFEVPDAETQMLMSEFYRRLHDGDSILQAFSEAQRAIIRQRREDYGAAHPFYWGSFTLLGTPR